METTQRSGSRLLDLPPEIRNTIYSLVLHDAEEEILCPFVWQLSPGKRKYGYSLTQTCRQIRRETLLMWHAGKKLLFAVRPENVAYYKNWLQRRPDDVFSSIRRLQLEDYQHCKQRCSDDHPSFCRSAIIINLHKASPVTWKRDRRCFNCPGRDPAADRVNAVVHTLRKDRAAWILTREKLEAIFEAAVWEI